MELYEVKLTTAEGLSATYHLPHTADLSKQLHALAATNLFEVCVREYGGLVWSVIDGWVMTDEKDISFEHCGQPAEWHGEAVICSKCQEVLTD